MPKYTCQNENCRKYGDIQTSGKSVISFKNGKISDTGSICPACGKTMNDINPVGFTTHMTGSDNICKK